MQPATILADATGPLPDAISALLVGLLAAAATLLLLQAVCRQWGTTLIGPCLWTLLACWSIAGVEILLLFSSPNGAPPLRYAAALSVFCPPLAVMGAKRPQQRPWQFVVLSLWVVLSLPALEVLLMHPGRPLDAGGLRAWLLPALILLGLANQLGTRYWPSAVLAAAAQVAVLLPFFPVLGIAGGVWSVAAGLALLDFSLALVLLGIPRRTVARTGLDRLWFDFRDAYGVLWSLRVAERFNATAQTSRWQVRLQWEGLVFSPGDQDAKRLPADVERLVLRNFKSLLRRFVSTSWIDSRLGKHRPYAAGGNEDAERGHSGRPIRR